MTTYYMVECDFPFPEEREGFDQFYNGHITMLLTIKGFVSAQRFECVHAARAPFLAVYELTDPAVMTSPAYTSKAGPTSVSETYRPKMKNWDRNLMTSVDPVTINVPLGGWLALIDRKVDAAPALPAEFASLRSEGLDKTLVERGVLTGEGEPSALGEGDGVTRVVRTFRALHPIRYPQ
ncbi:MAG: hypothetical protein K0U93_28845 [Gammaproteobacteria bacterium]|nr:hypothetical protein [Gammaproteobacteria bacterium]